MSTCQHCWGTGQEIDHAHYGRLARELRERLGLGQGRTARRMGVSGAYLSRLEKGKRPWSLELRKKFLRATGS